MAAPPTVSVARLQFSARAPRVAVLATCGVLTFAGVARTFSAPGAAPAPRTTIAAREYTEERGVAERFALEYFTLKPGGEDARQQRLQAFGLAEAAVSPDRLGGRPLTPRSVVTVATQARTDGVDVTVAVEDDSAWQYLAVPVRRTRQGLSISGPPALVGPPHVAVGELAKPEDEVQDAALKQVAARFVRHYLAGDRVDLAADLTPRSTVSPPVSNLRVTSFESVTWARAPRLVATTVRARNKDGLALTLRYELTVVRRGGRWLVAAVAGNPNTKEQRR